MLLELHGTPESAERVFFMNEILRNGRLFRCCQRLIIVKSAPSAEQAVEAAKKQFAELESFRDWKIHVAFIGRIGDRGGEGADQPLLVAKPHLGSAKMTDCRPHAADGQHS